MIYVFAFVHARRSSDYAFVSVLEMKIRSEREGGGLRAASSDIGGYEDDAFYVCLGAEDIVGTKAVGALVQQAV